MKRGRDGSLTGGTGDVSPQFMVFTVTQSAADTTTTTAQAIPVQRLQTAGKAQVMEVLKIGFVVSDLPASASATETIDAIAVNVSTTSFGTTATNWGEPRVFAAYNKRSRSAFTAAGTYFSMLQSEPFMLDVTDGAGHGILIATDNIYGQVVSSGTGGANVAYIKLLYRWKNVPMTEYVGIVQSQQ